MLPPAVILRHPTRQIGRVASVHAEPTPGGSLLRIARGDHPDRLSNDRTLGPFAADELQAAFDAAVAELRADGYGSGALAAALDLLARQPRNAHGVALAAGRLFWLADAAACEPLLSALADAEGEACVVIDALGRCGDERASAAARESAERKLLSRRRSGVEALIHLNDADGIAAALNRVRGDLPDGLVDGATTLADVEAKRRGQTADFLYEYAGLASDPAAADAAIAWAESLAGFDLGQPFHWRYVKSLLKRACLRFDADAFGRLSRLVDASQNRLRTFSVKSGLTGEQKTTPILSSHTRDYLRRRSWRHLRRLAEHEPGRYAAHAAALLAAYRPSDETVFRRRGDDSRYGRTIGIGAWSRSFLIGHVLHENDPTLQWSGMRWHDAAERHRRSEARRGTAFVRESPPLPPMPDPSTPTGELSMRQRFHMEQAGAVFEIEHASVFQRLLDRLRGTATPATSVRMVRPPDWERLRRRLVPPTGEPAPPPPDGRIEAYPELWDASPQAYLTLLARGGVPEFQQFAVDAIRERHADLLRDASPDDLLGMLDASLASIADFAATELRRRLDAEAPPWPLVERLAHDGRPDARAVAHDVLRRRPELWIGDAERLVGLLLGPHAETSDVAAGVLAGRLAGASPEHRRAVAARLLAILRDPPPIPVSTEPEVEDAAMFEAADDPRLDAIARVLADALAAEADDLVGATAALSAWFDDAPPLAVVAAAVLERRDDAAEAFGFDGLVRLAGHDLAAVRRAAMAVVTATPSLWSVDLTPLLSVAEGLWPDARLAALAVLFDRVELDQLGVDALQALLDSTLADVRAAAMRAAAANLEQLDAAELAGRLAEHPSRDVRNFAFDLAAAHLGPSAASLARLRPLVASSLLDATPSRRAKRQAIAALARHGVADADAARAAADLLLPLTRSAIPADAEAATAALVRVKLAHPDAFAGLHVAAIGGAA